MSWDNGTVTGRALVGGEVFDGQEPQGVVPAYRWQRARSEGDWTLLGTTVAPGFVPDGFEMKQDWSPDDGCWRQQCGRGVINTEDSNISRGCGRAMIAI